jgi:hypothetical protein
LMDWWLVLGKSFPYCTVEQVVLTYCSVLCSEMAVKQVDEPFITANDDRNEWAI